MTALVPIRPSLSELALLVCCSVSSPHTRRAYSSALSRFFAWWQASGHPPFSRAVVNAYRARLDAQGSGPASVNQALSAIRKLAAEARASGFLDESTAQGITSLPSVRQLGTRAGNWLTVAQCRALLAVPDVTRLKGLRDRALLALALGTGIRREELAGLTVEHIQQRDGRWCIVDLAGKGGRIRTVAMPEWCKAAVDAWLATWGEDRGKIGGNRLFRSIDKAGHIDGDSLSASAVWDVVTQAAAKCGLKVSPHDLRRTHGKLAREGGADLDQIQISFGHSCVSTTQKYLGDLQDLKRAPCDYLGI